MAALTTPAWAAKTIMFWVNLHRSWTNMTRKSTSSDSQPRETTQATAAQSLIQARTIVCVRTLKRLKRSRLIWVNCVRRSSWQTWKRKKKRGNQSGWTRRRPRVGITIISTSLLTSLPRSIRSRLSTQCILLVAHPLLTSYPCGVHIITATTASLPGISQTLTRRRLSMPSSRWPIAQTLTSTASWTTTTKTIMK